MSEIHIKRIAERLVGSFKSSIDLSDVTAKSDEEKEKFFLTRSLAAYTLQLFNDITTNESAKSVTDMYGDRGIDAIFINKQTSVIYIVQSKWTKSGNGAPDQADVLKFINGCGELINLNFKKFNAKIRSMESDITSALLNADYKVCMILTYNGIQKIAPEIEGDLIKFISTVNDTAEVLEYKCINQKDLYESILAGTDGSPINLKDLKLYEWGKIENPYLAYYGQIHISEVAKWWETHRDRLLIKNLRKYKGITAVNDAMKSTLSEKPINFWYFNNGITILCETIVKSPAYTDNKIGVFECRNISIVNGAQTVGTIGNYYLDNNQEVDSNAMIQVKIISIQNMPEDISSSITKYTNTQNKIENKDFAALDPNQERLRQELLLEGKIYHYKASEKSRFNELDYSIEDATAALACATGDIDNAVQAKREIGKFWENIEKAPYKLVFNDSTTAIRLWRCTDILKVVEKELVLLCQNESDRNKLISVHANRFILHEVFRVLNVNKFDIVGLDFEKEKELTKKRTKEVFDLLKEVIKEKFSESYIQTLFRNLNKCRELSNAIIQKERGISDTLF